MMNRRRFLATGAAGAAAIHSAGCVTPVTPTRISVHPFVERHPEAVFIMRTNVGDINDTAAIRRESRTFADSVFIPHSHAREGMPLDAAVAMKPNLTCRGTWQDTYTHDRARGVVTDPYFMEGIIESLKNAGISAGAIHMRESNCPEDFEDDGYWGPGGLTERTGAGLRDMSAVVGELPAEDIVWKDIRDGVFFNRIPYLRPVNADDAWLVNVAKFKAHPMGITLASKNLQGTNAHNYNTHCRAHNNPMDIDQTHMVPGAFETIGENWRRHVADGIPRWDRPCSTDGLYSNLDGGLGQETWVSRCLDNVSVCLGGLHIVEGIYGHDGNFTEGPGPDGEARDYLSNVIIFGMNPLYVDIIGHWLAGQEPGNFGLFHIARERGFIATIDPSDIPVYSWQGDGTPELTGLETFARTPLKTCYLPRDYNGGEEPYWHLCNEPFDYSAVAAVAPGRQRGPTAGILPVSHPGTVAFEIDIPRGSEVLLEIRTPHGAVIAAPVSGHLVRGTHYAVWKNPLAHGDGCIWRFRTRGYETGGVFGRADV